jgi:AbrB family looped-hinge helix DNA binding protein
MKSDSVRESSSGFDEVFGMSVKHQPRTILRVGTRGRIVIPAAIRQRLGIEVGNDLVMTVEKDMATIMTARAARRRAQELVRRHIQPGASLSKELMAERKKEANRDTFKTSL